MTNENAIVAVYSDHLQAELAVDQLKKIGFDMTKLSIVGKDYHTEENVVGYYNAGDRMKHWGKMGAFWGGLWGPAGRRRPLFRAGYWAGAGSRSRSIRKIKPHGRARSVALVTMSHQHGLGH
jgi:heat induced stress protein YflT